MEKSFLITGGTGFIGGRLVNSLATSTSQIKILTRNPSKNVKADCHHLKSLQEISNDDNIDVIVNLAGEPISKRWSNSYKQQLISSRIQLTSEVIDLIKRLNNKPKLLISASAIGYYGSQDSSILQEDSEFQAGFTHTLCQQWEQIAHQASGDCRVCILRLGVVLGANGGALQQMLPSFKLGLGGKLGSGEQYFSWVHMDDVISVIHYLIDTDNLNGTFNCTAPSPVTNYEFSKALCKTLHRPMFFNLPAWVVNIMFGEMGKTLLLEGQRVIPKKLIDSGYQFKFDNIDNALEDILDTAP